MRRCKIAPSSCKQPDKLCCKGCPDKLCKSRCLNDPKWGGCWDEAPPPRKREPRDRLDREAIFRLHSQGLLQREIAAWLGCSKSGVSAVLQGQKGDRYAGS